MKRNIIAILLLFACAAVSAQESGVKVKVTDEKGTPVSGAEILVQPLGLPVLTDDNGEAEIHASVGDEMTVSLFNRYQTVVTVDSSIMTVMFTDRDLLLDSGYGRKLAKRYSSMAIDGVGSADIDVTRNQSVLNSVQGLVPGLLVTSAENVPWSPTPDVFVRGRGSFNGNQVIFFVDGVERDPSLIVSEEVESVSVLKDAAALALYGVRGADGVVLITTKRGSDQGMRIMTDYNFSVETPFGLPEMASASEYASAVNEALYNDGLAARYSGGDIESLRSGTNSMIPVVDWQEQLLRKAAFTHDFNLSMDGSEKRMRYYVYANYHGYSGLLNNTGLNDGYSTQMQMSRLKLRSNLEADITRTTRLKLNMMGNLNQYQEPANGHNLTGMYDTPAIAFPVKAEDGTWVRSSMFANPLAYQTASGYNVYVQRALYADMTIEQDLSAISEGLTFRLLASYDNSATIKDGHTKSYSYYNMSYVYDEEGNVTDKMYERYGNDTELSFSSSLMSGDNVYTRFTLTGRLDYERRFGKHGVRADGIYSMTRKKARQQNSIYSYIDYILRAGYDFDRKYFVDVVADCSGSAYLMDGDKFRFYPAVSAAWLLSSEDWMKNAGSIDFLKLRASFGVSGYDGRIGYGYDKVSAGSGNNFISMPGTVEHGLALTSYPSESIEPETDCKADVAVEMTAFKGLDIQLEGYYNHRTGIKVSSDGVYSALLGLTAPVIFTGETENYGVELSLGWNRKHGDFWYHIGGTAAYNCNRILEMGEEYHPYSYMYRTGNSIGTMILYQDAGLYQKDDFASDGSLLPGNAVSTLVTSVQPGDVKYVDVNEDGQIDGYDKKYMPEYSSDPYLSYGINLGFRWRNLGMEAMFTGIEGKTVQLTLSSVYWPLYENNRNISRFYLADHWSESNPNGKYPRLTTLSNGNNFQGGSTMWLESGDFFKLKSLYVYYNFQNRADRKWFSEIRIFLRGYNLLSFDSVKLFDPESITSGYPSVRQWQAGVKFTF